MTAVGASFLSAVPVLAFVVLLVAFVVYCEVDIARAGSVRYLPRWLWGAICLLFVPLGGIAYLALGRPSVGAGDGVAPSGPWSRR